MTVVWGTFYVRPRGGLVWIRGELRGSPGSCPFVTSWGTPGEGTEHRSCFQKKLGWARLDLMALEVFPKIRDSVILLEGTRGGQEHRALTRATKAAAAGHGLWIPGSLAKLLSSSCPTAPAPAKAALGLRNPQEPQGRTEGVTQAGEQHSLM